MSAGGPQASGPPPLTCEETFRRLDDYLDRELSGGERALVERHLDSCAECADEYRFEASVLDALREKLDGLRVPRGLVDRVRARLDREPDGTGD